MLVLISRQCASIIDLVNVVMHVLASDDWCNGVGFLSTSFSTGILELQTLFLKTSFDGARVAVLDLTGLYSGHTVRVLFGKNLAVLDWLN